MPQPLTPEQHAREQIDDMLRQAGWAVQNVRQINLAAATGVALRELPMKGGTADYALFVSKQLVGIIEAKRVGTTLGGVEAQTRPYASGVPSMVKAPITPLPFQYERTGMVTWGTHGLDLGPKVSLLRVRGCPCRTDGSRPWRPASMSSLSVYAADLV